MNRTEELTLKLADEALTESEARELESLLADNEAARRAHVQILRIEAVLRGQRKGLEMARPVMERIRSAQADSVARGVIAQIKLKPAPEWRREQPRAGGVWQWFSVVYSPGLALRLGIAIALVAAAIFAIWNFSAVQGTPTLADVQGAGVILERSGQRLTAGPNVRLQPGDVLRTSSDGRAVICFPPEETRMSLSPGTVCKLTTFARGKHFELEEGTLEATVARQRPFRPMLLKTPQAEARVIGTRFTLTVTTNSTRLDVTEGRVRFTRTRDAHFVRVDAGHYAVAAADYELAALPLTGSILRECWTNVPGSYPLLGLMSNPRFPLHPDSWDYLDRFETRSNWGTNCAARICGYLQPPATGDYTFWISSQDGDLYLSSDDDPQNRRWIAHAENVQPPQWNDSRGQQSAPITLKAGRKYYIEALQIQGINRDNFLAVAWQGPGRNREVIPGEFLAPLQPPIKK
jgi:hypothetical protein